MNKKVLGAGLAATILGIGIGTRNPSEMASLYRKISFEKMYEITETMSNDEYAIVDVRTEEEYDSGHIKGAVLIPDYAIETITNKYDKDKLLFVHCRSGARSRGAVNKLISMGYTNVYDVGGIIDYPYELEY